MKKLLLTILFTITVSQAKMLGAIAVTVDGEAITTTEIQAVKEQMDVSKQEAIDILIQDRLQQIAIKDIQVPENDIDKKIEMIAKQNSVTVPKMQKILKEQGTSWTQYRSNIKKAMKKEKFFAQKVAKEMQQPTDDDLRLFYETHANEFIIPSSISVVEYSAPTKEEIESFMNTGTGIEGQTIEKDTSTLNPTMLQMLLRTPDGRFTQALNAGDRYIAYKVVSKNGQTNIAFEEVKPAISMRWQQEQREKVLKEYFKKMRTSADIQIIRK